MVGDGKDERLEKLLKLKRLEMPSDERWCEFDRAFENKVLASVKDPWPKKVFSSISSFFFMRGLMFVPAVVLMLLVTYVAVVGGKSTVRLSPIAREQRRNCVEFADDRMFEADSSTGSLGTKNINFGDDGVEYVRDMLPLQRGGLLFAGM
jgi:hypothetical protein